MKNQKSLLNKIAKKYGVDPQKLFETLKKTVFKVKDGEITNEQLMSLLIVADQYNLNPFTREIIAFVDKQGGVVPGVTVDGWCRIINDHPQFDGVEFNYSEEIETPKGGKPCPVWCEAIIYRKDRSHPVKVKEFLDEVYRPPFEGQKNGKTWTVDGPWQSHTKRMLRHKALIQAARIAFGFSGIYDEDEAIRIVHAKNAGTDTIDTYSVVESADNNALPQGGVYIDMSQTIPVALKKQIEIRAKQKGIQEVPEFQSVEEAKQFLDRLIKATEAEGEKKEEKEEPQPQKTPQPEVETQTEAEPEVEETLW